MSKDRILWLDTLKIMAIYLVVLGHIVSTTYQPDLKGIIYSFHMPLFFMISGYLNKDKRNAIKANVFALIVPYVLLCVLYLQFQNIGILFLFVIQAICGIVAMAYCSQKVHGGRKYVCLISQGTILIYVFHFAFLPLGGKVLNLFADKTDWFYCILQSLLALIILLLFIKPIELLLHKCPLLLGHYHIKK